MEPKCSVDQQMDMMSLEENDNMRRLEMKMKMKMKI